MKLLTEAEKAKCVLFMDRFQSPTVVQRKYRSFYKTKYAPSVNSIKKWYSEFQERGHMRGDSTGRKVLSEVKVGQIKDFFEDNPKTSLRQGARELNIPMSSVHKTLRKTLRFYPYKIKLIQAMKPEDGPARQLFADTMLRSIQDDPDYLKRICFSDEATFHTAGIVNRHNVRIWGTSHPREYVEKERNSPKVNVWCGLLHDRVIGPFFFDEPTITSDSYLHMLETFAYQELQQLHNPDIIFQQDGAPPHFGLQVRASLNQQFPGR